MTYPRFVADKDFIDMDSTVPEIEQLRAMLGNLTRIHLLTANKFADFDALIRAYIEAGIDVFGLETGIVSKITVDGSYEVCDVVSPLDVLHKGQIFPLEDTYCREVAKSHQVIGFPEVGKLEYMKCHPVYQNLQLEAYLSAPIFVEDQLFGTFNFTSTQARGRGFSEHERDLVTLMANSIGAYILLRSKEEKLIRLNEKIKRFVGYVAHDLRNPLGAIIGLAKLGKRDGVKEERMQAIIHRISDSAETALELVTTILENAALSTGKITLDKSSADLRELITEAIESVHHFAHEEDIRFNLEIEANVTVLCDVNRIHQSLTNLLINAIKYSPRSGEVKLALFSEKDPSRYRVKVENSIDQERVNSSAEWSRTYDSVGFGLDIVSEVLNAHDELLTVTESPSLYVVEFTLTKA
ncbi:GAF sensor-containing signal transduction histidine kinase [Oleiphilus messinensis]|uniref:histidine kinase n=1 Tax=Oleiphilus messinensis TaxID=141451 RepID=A0A1Y0ICJ2_9GAMM|nr:GAF domain-containing sensor histidine kinase [Oleiphilus messinensis]ARU58248.1 GAF sensor-containing signal transduction histidine kinase [Oleiphilus messinensis]